jgi:hypothetical protein
MKEELQSKLVEILTAMQTVAGQAKDFTLEQLPDIAQSYVVYGRASSVISLLAGCFLIWCAVLLGRKVYEAYKKDESHPIAILGAFGMVAFSVVIFAWNLFALKAAALVWFAPKVWLLKEIAGMLK